MSLDATLLAMGQAMEVNANLGNFDAFQAEFREFMFQWAGVQNVDPLSRGALGSGGNAQELEFLEHYTGTPFVTPLSTDSDFTNQWILLHGVFAEAQETLSLRYLSQSDANLKQAINYDGTTDSLSLASNDIAVLMANAPAGGGADTALYWAALSTIKTDDPFLKAAILEQLEQTGDALSGSQMDFFNIDIGTSAGEYVDGVYGNREEILIGGAGNDQASPFNLNVDGTTFTGGAGDDIATTADGDDFFYGGTGNDTFNGRSGSDTYVFNLGDGQDFITDQDVSGLGVDRIYLGGGITAADVTYSRDVNNQANIVISIGAGGDQITVQNFYVYDNGWDIYANLIEEIVFKDGTVHDVNHIMAGFNLQVNEFFLGLNLHI